MRKQERDLRAARCVRLLASITGYASCDAGLCFGEPAAVAAESLVDVYDVAGERALVRVRATGSWAWVDLAQVSARDAMPLFG